MELFKKTNFDFLGHKWPFIIASLVLSVAGLLSLAVKGGPKYGIEFKGGMIMTVKFAQPPDIEKLRGALTRALPSPPSVQSFGGTNEVEIEAGLDMSGGSKDPNAGLDKSKQIILDTLAAVYGQPKNGKLDLNNASASQVASRITEPLQRAGVQLSQQQVDQLAADVIAWRDKNGGLITKIDDLRAVPGLTPQVANVLNQESYLAPYTAARNIEMVGPKVGADLRRQAMTATMLALAGMLVYIWFRFEWIYGVGAVIAVFHDTIITIGIFSILDKEISLTVIAALLTLVGYSMNDTIVIFDRIRENLHLNRRERLDEVINRSVNQTLSRTLMTSGLTFLAVVALFLFGGPVLHGFSLALVIGIIIGTYSSVFVASPIVIFWHNWADQRKKTAPEASVGALRQGPAKRAVTKSSVKAVK
jgi:preprotein translocase subunit SecF